MQAMGRIHNAHWHRAQIANQALGKCAEQGLMFSTLSSTLPSEAEQMIQLTCLVESLHVEMGPSGWSDSTLSGEACQLRTCRWLLSTRVEHAACYCGSRLN